MRSLKHTVLIFLGISSLFALGRFEIVGADEATKAEGIPQIAHFDVKANYIAASPTEPAISPARFRIRVRGSIFVPANTKVGTKILTQLRPNWSTTETYGPFPKGHTVEYVKSWDVDARTWNGKSFTAKLMASSSAGVDVKEASVVPMH